VAYRSIGRGNYDGLNFTVRKTFNHGVQFDFNYTRSRCLDLGSAPESIASTTSQLGASGVSSGMILNPGDPNQNWSLMQLQREQRLQRSGRGAASLWQGPAADEHRQWLFKRAFRRLAIEHRDYGREQPAHQRE
jgi:hypothetical protein